MKVAVLSGKGGAGKTFVALNLAYVSGNGTYADCDVEEPNGKLFLKAENIKKEAVYKILPSFDKEKCTGCRNCVSGCRFNALMYLLDRPVLFPELCHSCGLCGELCPAGAVGEKKAETGFVEEGRKGELRVVFGSLKIGEASGVPVIKAVLEKASENGGLVVIDCPPGSACAAMECVKNCDYCIIVAEPTAFGLHNFKMAAELSEVLKKPYGTVINKAEGEYEPLKAFLEEKNIPLLLSIPYEKKTAAFISSGKIAAEEDAGIYEMFRKLLAGIGGLAK